MHPRQELQIIIDGVREMIIDALFWNDNRRDQPPMDCEPERIVLKLAEKAADEWDRGRTSDALSTMRDLSMYTKNHLKGVGE